MGKAMYAVTVTPVIITYAGSSVFGEYVVEVYAKNGSDAITRVRRERNAEEGRYGVKATYKAKKLQK